MPRAKALRWCSFFIVLALIVLLVRPAGVGADGGPWTRDHQRWVALQEVEQIAVVGLESSAVAQVDLFISLWDGSGEAQQVLFFLPLGRNPTSFAVVEEGSRAFEQTLTNPLDQVIAQESERTRSYRQWVLLSLFGGMMAINGGWTWPLWLGLSLVGCGVAAPVAPVATYETENSRIELYQIDPDTDLQQLIGATGLDLAVRETLARLEGQQIAVVTLRTQPAALVGADTPGGQPGIHISWAAELQAGAEASTYDYPLGTGQAWAQPVEKTRVYVVAPPGVDFTVEYPRLGPEDRDYDPLSWGSEPAFRVDDVVGEFGRIWRIVYAVSNASEDIRITRLPGLSESTQAALRQRQWQQPVRLWTLPAGLLLSLSLWVVAWRYVMPYYLGTRYRWRDWNLWRDAIGWALVYPLSNAAALATVALPVGLAWALASLLGQAGRDLPVVVGLSCLVVPWVIFVFVALVASSIGLISGYLFARARSRTSGVSRERALTGYAVVVVLTNLVYIALGVVYAMLIRVL